MVKVGDSVTVFGHGEGVVEAIGTTYDDNVHVHPLRDRDGEVVYNDDGEVVNTGMCYGTSQFPVRSYLIRLSGTNELIRVRD